MVIQGALGGLRQGERQCKRHHAHREAKNDPAFFHDSGIVIYTESAVRVDVSETGL